MTRSDITSWGLAAICLPLAALVETGALLFPTNWSVLAVTAIIRFVQILIICLLIIILPGASALAGFSTTNLIKGIQIGMLVSVAFGLLAATLGGVLYLLGFSPLNLVRGSIPYSGSSLVLFFVTGGIIGPVAEEIVFRAIIFRTLRPLGLSAAVLLSTIIFALLHFHGNGFPLIQCAGGIIFALCFERSGHIVTPMIVHSAGNLALFSLALFSS
ncbi:MAG: CPBP family intramembrane glutamic endopeptidase [Pseudomonadota bacterium]